MMKSVTLLVAAGLLIIAVGCAKETGSVKENVSQDDIAAYKAAIKAEQDAMRGDMATYEKETE
ncbi:hypothetical protein Pla22_04070 [Rubripirellula amarantea]|uniref:Secreted protein n=1 Tax=Rubripirellula amarantea TaxID=2527999 RepID=A0A5C5WRL9_9BACT|nr:hypothetical protein [Rubripirellula amarantea]TWT52781.1 hypothetical protein Pla22_04070 [Rubripirellula amarantea]